MSERNDTFLAMVDHAFGGPSWHGATLRQALAGLEPEVAAWVPGAGRRSIWQLLLHAAYWKHIAHTSLTGSPEDTFGRSPKDWPGLPAQRTRGALEKDIAFLVAEHDRLREAITGFEPTRWDAPAHESGVTYAEVVEGVAFHDVHHGGQIQLLKQIHAL